MILIAFSISCKVQPLIAPSIQIHRQIFLLVQGYKKKEKFQHVYMGYHFY